MVKDAHYYKKCVCKVLKSKLIVGIKIGNIPFSGKGVWALWTVNFQTEIAIALFNAIKF